jgi:tetratricopeptide (TPR) repeat protein
VAEREAMDLLAAFFRALSEEVSRAGVQKKQLATLLDLSASSVTEMFSSGRGGNKTPPSWERVERILLFCWSKRDHGEFPGMPEAAVARVRKNALAQHLENWKYQHARLVQEMERARKGPVAASQAPQGITGVARAVFPAVSKAPLNARIHRAVRDIAYIHRDVEDQVREYLSAPRPVLLVGPSMVGKTRMAATLLTDMFGARQIVIPDSKDDLAELNAAGIALRDAVIWLDDIDRLIGADGITGGSLQRLAAAGNVIMATIRAREYERYRPTDQFRPPEWNIICVFERVFIGRELSERERQRLTEAVSDAETRNRILEAGLGEYAGAAGQIAEALRLGPDVNPVGYALCLGAADWRRCGMTRPVPASALPGLAEPHLGARNSARLSDKRAYADGLGWATRQINPTVSLLQPIGTDAFTVYDYALDLISEQATVIPDSTWRLVIQNATEAERVSIGYTAQFTYGRPEVAILAWSQAANAEPTSGANAAAVGLGWLLAGQGDLAGARAAYQRAVDSGDASVVPMATVGLADALHKLGELDSARAAYQRVIDSGNADMAPKATVGLADVLRDLGDTDGARAAYQRAIDSGDEDEAPRAAVGLGLMLQDLGDLEGAQTAFQRAIDSGHADRAPMAAVGLGIVLYQLGDIEGARAAWEWAVASGHPQHAPTAADALKSLQQEGDAADTEAGYQPAIDSGHPDHAPIAAIALGERLQQEGDIRGARAAYQKAIDSGHADMAAMAATHLGALLAEQGDIEGARAAFQKAIDSGHPDHAPIAAIALGAVLSQEGDIKGARAAFQKAIDSGHPKMAPLARSFLDELE